MNNNGTLDATIIDSKCMEYLRISKAAEILASVIPGITCADDLLHMGATGNAEIMAPVVSGGQFEWPIGSDGIAFPEIDKPFRRQFNAVDRVILSRNDLTQIEAVGWVIPNTFSAPSAARKVIEDLQFWMPDPSVTNCELTAQNDANDTQNIIKLLQTQLSGSNEPDLEAITITTCKGKNREMQSLTLRECTQLVIENFQTRSRNPLDSDDLSLMREIAFYAPWRAVRPFGQDTEKTTIAHLFISKKELERIKNSQHQYTVALIIKKQAADTLPENFEDTSVKPDTKNPIANWKMRIQEQAAIIWTNSKKNHCNPTKNNIKRELAKWCRENGVTTDSAKFPDEAYIYRHVLSNWTPPSS